MAKFRSNSAKKKNGIVRLKIVVEKLQKSLSLGKKSASDYDDLEEVIDSAYVPPDVKEGHFAQSAEEYGFDHEGALTIPCRPSELERLLAEQWQPERDPSVGANWDSCKTLVKSC
ncbi:hypothetical protein CK203_004647 [Vitis vinifera]|uniref:Uncharacterized protein n=1 Tax=Vitis vinifera TaxID=29760 RepID=A0A438KGM8_VITVI|nr:hypothetical protein CK203_004647 [Vitis vinifera]